MREERPTTRQARAFLVDLVLVVAFVLIGRSNHDEPLEVGATVTTAAPFVIGLVTGWAVVVWRHFAVTGVAASIAVVGSTVVVGLLARVLVFGHGVAAPFAIVTLLVVTFLLAGWRRVAWSRRSARVEVSR